jgi:uncharacterized protein YrrD
VNRLPEKDGNDIMLRRLKGLIGDALRAQDGHIGHVNEILFDDTQWSVRYLTVNTGSLLLGNRVLIAPRALGKLEWDRHLLNVNLTREQVEKSPGLGTDEPVSRQFETNYYDYYAWPYYWSGIPYGGMALYGGMGTPDAFGPLSNQQNTEDLSYQHAGEDAERDQVDTHLRSTKEVTGYGIAARDGHLGHVEDFIFDDETWNIRYLAVDTQNWWPGKRVLLPLDCIENMSWPDRAVTVRVTRDQVRQGPEWHPNEPISSSFEQELSSYFAHLPITAPASVS